MEQITKKVRLKAWSCKKWFTLIELIVVITILAILWTIAFIALQWYSRDARDATRISDMSRIKTSLELFTIDVWKYPETTNGESIVYWTSDAWIQWTFWEQTFRNVEKLDKIPLDPLTDSKYIYSVINSRKEYQIAWILESNSLALNTEWEEVSLKIVWNYNWQMLNVKNGTDTTILAIPSIIALCWTTVDEIVTNNYFLHDWYDQFPKDFNGKKSWLEKYTQCDWTGIPLVNNSSYELFTWDINSLFDEDNTQQRLDFISKLQNSYNWTKFATTNDKLKSILSLNINTNPSWAEIFAKWILRNAISNKNTIALSITPWNSSSSNSTWNSNTSNNVYNGGWSDWSYWPWSTANSNWKITRTNTRYCNNPVPSNWWTECLRDDWSSTNFVLRIEEKLEYANTTAWSTTNTDWSTTTTIENSDGSTTMTTTDLNGTTTVVNMDNEGTIITINSDGSTTETSSDWANSTEVTNPNGTTSKIKTNPDWSISVTNPNWTVTNTTQNPDGSKVTSTNTSDWGIINTIENSEGVSITINSKPDGSKEISLDEPEKEAIKTEIKPDPEAIPIAWWWSNWEFAVWGQPSLQTGIMYRKVTRYCNTPIPVNWWDECLLENGVLTTYTSRTEEKTEEKLSIQNWVWSEWSYSAWSDADASWQKTRTKTRYCNNPDPAYGWTECTREDLTLTTSIDRKEEEIEYGSITPWTTTAPDGSTTTATQNSDGTITMEITDSDGKTTTATQNLDGTTTTQNPSWTTTTQSSDGTATTTELDGTTTEAAPDGTTTETAPDGTITETTPDGTTTETTTDGTITETTPDGTITEVSTSNISVDWEWGDWSYTEWVEFDSNWWKKRTASRYCNNPAPAYGGDECVRENSQITSNANRVEEKDEYSNITPGTNQNPDWSTTTATENSDGSVISTTTSVDWEKTTTVTEADWTTSITTNSDGSTTTTIENLDGEIETVTQNPDGSTTVKEADGSTTVKEPDGTVETITQNPDWSIVSKINNSDWWVTETISNTDGTVETTTQKPDGTKEEVVVTPDSGASPVNWWWSDWESSDWWEPSVETQKIYRTKTRYCNNPIPVNWWIECTREDSTLTLYNSRTEEKIEQKSALEDWDWSDWNYSAWSDADLSWEKTRIATRYCNNPEPSYGWSECTREDLTLTTSNNLKEEKIEYINEKSWETTNPDGSTTVTTEDSDGTKVMETTTPDGNTTTATQSPNGTTTTENQDWSTTSTSWWGATTSYPNWSTSTVSEDWWLTKTEPDWKITTQNPDGWTTVKEPDGTTTTTEPDGTVTKTEPDGTVTKTEPDGTIEKPTDFVDWDWSNWKYSNWSQIDSKTWLKTREGTRYCNNPTPWAWGKWCTREDWTVTNWESFTEIKTEEESFSKDWWWSDWTHGWWGLPDSSGIRSRVATRYCNNPTPLYWGKYCSRTDWTLTTWENPQEENNETESVSLDWWWSDWVYESWNYLAWYTKMRGARRYCNNPIPIYGGKECTRENWSLTSSSDREDQKVDTQVWVSSTSISPLGLKTITSTFPDSSSTMETISPLGISTLFMPGGSSIMTFPSWKLIKAMLNPFWWTTETTFFPDLSVSSIIKHLDWTNTTSTTTAGWVKTTNYPDGTTTTETNVANVRDWRWTAWKWTNWSSIPNGNNMYTRNGSRRCNNPFPETGWERCKREDWSITNGSNYYESKTDEKSASIDWGWRAWDWSGWSYPDSNNIKRKTWKRYCDNPAPRYWGSECMREDWSYTKSSWDGRNIWETKIDEQSASIDWGWSSWDWSGWIWSSNDQEKRIWYRICNNPRFLYWGSKCMKEDWSFTDSREDKTEYRSTKVEWNVKTSTYPDGGTTTTTANPDGSSTSVTRDPNWSTVETTIEQENGTTTTTWSDGTVTTEQPNGTVIKEELGWITITEEADGTVTTEQADGTTTTVTWSGGLETETAPDGTVTETAPDGTVTETDIDGTVTETDAVGTVIQTAPDGTVTETDADGIETETAPDGTVTETDAVGIVIQTAPDGTVTETDADGIVTETAPDGTVIETETLPDGTTTTTTTNPDGSMTWTTTESDGTLTETSTDTSWNTTATTTESDGTTTDINSDGTSTTTEPDGTIIETTPDWTTTTTDSDWTTTTTSENEDWSTTSTTDNPDWSSSTATNNPDWSTTTTETDSNGNTTTTETDSGGLTIIDWECWDDNNLDFTETPTNLCNAWIASTVIDGWPWNTYNWTCVWENNWIDIICNANNINDPNVPAWWMLVDSNCDKHDVTIWWQTWAGCNSTIGTWIEFSETTISSCMSYEMTSEALGVTCNSVENASTAKENAWNATYWIDNIWWKLYTWANSSAACSDWYHLPSIWEYNKLLKNLWCSDVLNDRSKWYLCEWLWWLWNNTNSLVDTLWLPLSGNRLPDWINFGNRWILSNLWTSTASWLWTVSVWVSALWDWVSHESDSSSLAYSVRCIKDNSTTLVESNDNAWYFYIKNGELINYDESFWTDVDLSYWITWETITSIWPSALEDLWITSVTIPSTVTSIWDYAFFKNPLTNVVIPNSVTSIWNSAFEYCESLSSLTLSNTLTSIWDYAFYSNSLSSVTIPNTVTSIWDWAFDYNYITSLVIPSSVTSIWEYAFADNELASVTFQSDVANLWVWSFAWQDNSVWAWTVYWPASWNVYEIYNTNNWDDAYDVYWDGSVLWESYFDDTMLVNYSSQ